MTKHEHMWNSVIKQASRFVRKDWCVTCGQPRVQGLPARNEETDTASGSPVRNALA